MQEKSGLFLQISGVILHQNRSEKLCPRKRSPINKMLKSKLAILYGMEDSQGMETSNVHVCKNGGMGLNLIETRPLT